VGVVTAFAMASQLAHVVGLRFWGVLADRHGSRPVLALTAPVFALTLLAWTLTVEAPTTGTLVAVGVLHVLLGLATAGLDLASTSATLKLAPDADAAAFLSVASIVKASAAGVGALAGGVLAFLLADRSLAIRFVWSGPGAGREITVALFSHYDFLFLFAALVCLYAAHRLLAFREEGEAPPETVARALRREVQTVSSVAGLRQFAHVASYLVEALFLLPRGWRRDPDEDGSPERSRSPP
jgi:MFS family permease